MGVIDQAKCSWDFQQNVADDNYSIAKFMEATFLIWRVVVLICLGVYMQTMHSLLPNINKILIYTIFCFHLD